MKKYEYRVLVQWREGERLSLSTPIRVEADMDHDKVVRVVRECLMHVKAILEINDE